MTKILFNAMLVEARKVSCFFSLAITKALSKPAPGSIPLSGKRSLRNDFYAPYLEFPAQKWQFLVKSEIPRGYVGVLWEEQREGRDATLLRSELAELAPQLQIEHYYRGYQINYRTPVSFILGTSLGLHRAKILKERFSQELYNRRQLVRSERVDLLRLMTEKSIEKPGTVFHPLLFGTGLHSSRWFHHPGYEEQKAYLKMLMESLVQTGELERRDTDYMVTPKALVTLSEYAKDERKHSDNVRTARAGNLIAVAVVLVGAIGIIAQVTMWCLGPRG